ncbi:MAG: DMT family transporter [Alphaproteobacteria bacterium]|nr:DMT family transporter [Alphaproteobacteria bacterium]
MTAPEWAMLLALALLWGGSFFFVGVAVGALPPLTIVLVRVGLAATALLAVLALLRTGVPRGAAAWRAFAVMGFANNVVPFGLIVWGQGHIASGLASILNATTPLFTVVVAHFLTRDEPMTAARLAGVVLGLAGVAVLVGGGAAASAREHVPAQAACLAAALSYALAGIYGRRFRAMGVAPLATAAGQLAASAAMLLPLVLIVDRPWKLAMPSPAVVAALIGLAGLSTALAYVLYFRILATAGATNLLLVTFLLPPTAILLGTSFLGETLAARHLAGMVLIALGLAAIDGRPARLLAGRRA